jgi:hypothetical protein
MDPEKLKKLQAQAAQNRIGYVSPSSPYTALLPPSHSLSSINAPPASTHHLLPTPLPTALYLHSPLTHSRGKGTPRRKTKKVHKSTGTDDKKLQTSLKKLNVQPIQAIEEVNMFKEDGNVIHFAAPKGKPHLLHTLHLA